MRPRSSNGKRINVLRIDRYIMQRFVAGIIPALLLLLALFSFLTLAEELEDVGKGSFMLPDALMVVFLTTPKRIVELLPITALLGGLIGLGAMANHRELIAMRTSGISKQRISQTIALLAVFLGILITALQFWVVPGFEREAARLRGQASPGMETMAGNSQAFWTRNKQHFIRVDGVQSDRRLTGIEIYSTDDQGRLTQFIQASSAFYLGQDNWLLSSVLENSFNGAKKFETARESLQWNGLLSTEQAAILILPLEALAPNDLINTIATLKQNKLDTYHFLLGSVRSVSASQRVMIGGLIGISFYLVQQMSGHMAGILGMNPALVILTPPFIMLAIAVAAIRHRSL
jgi:lipopolysaccharide export system permease protein